MIPCKILVRAPYSDYQGSGTNRKARVHAKGVIVRFPLHYALVLEGQKMVEILDETANYDTVEVIEIDESEQAQALIETPPATDSAIEYAASNDIDLTKVEPTGADGQIILTDVRSYQKAQVGQANA